MKSRNLLFSQRVDVVRRKLMLVILGTSRVKPECLMKFCKMTVNFVFVDEILRCDHSNESSPPVLSHGAFCFSKF